MTTLGPFLAANNAGSVLAAPVNTTQTTIQVSAGGGALFPNPTGNEYFSITTFNADTLLPREIMWCTNVSGDVLTVIRAQEGTTATDCNVYDPVQNLWTAGQAMACVQANFNPVPYCIIGFTMSNDAIYTTSKLDFGAGQVRGQPIGSGLPQLIVGSDIVKSISATWAAGSGNGGMGPGLTASLNTWYHAYAALINGVFDIFFDNVPFTPTHIPSGTTSANYIGSFLTDSSANIIPFTQIGQRVYWNTPISNLNTSSPATSDTLLAVSCPSGITSIPILRLNITDSTPGASITAVHAFSTSNPAAAVVAQAASIINSVVCECVANASSQIYYVATASATVTITTLGYINPNIGAQFGIP